MGLLSRMFSKLLVGLVRAYQILLSPWLGGPFAGICRAVRPTRSRRLNFFGPFEGGVVGCEANCALSSLGHFRL
ncbi:MAG: hypothetical protein CM1200mP36_01710 [Gammaproteobacteria bacterium]|nr:MAG: hypothetical protein CM1200mP36_01710 [Gammaproteobacteria bacterium]